MNDSARVQFLRELVRGARQLLDGALADRYAWSHEVTVPLQVLLLQRPFQGKLDRALAEMGLSISAFEAASVFAAVLEGIAHVQWLSDAA